MLSFTRRVSLEDRPEPEPGPGEVLVRPEYVGICGTDLHAGSLQHFRPGVVMGHEFSATVAGVGPGVSGWAQGDRAVINPNGNVCGNCRPCVGGRPNLCRPAVFEEGIGIHRDGGMAPFTVVDSRVLHALPDGVSDEEGAFVEPLATAIRAVGKAEVSTGVSVLVIGGGPIGLLVLQVLRQTGVSRVSLVERVAYRRAVAERLGADAVHASIRSIRATEQPHVVLECSGSPSGLGAALRVVAPAGRVVVVGIPVRSGAFAPFDLIGKEVDVRGSIIYIDEFADAIEMLAKGLVDVRSMITGVEPLRRFRQAFDALLQPDSSVKVLLRP